LLKYILITGCGFELKSQESAKDMTALKGNLCAFKRIWEYDFWWYKKSHCSWMHLLLCLKLGTLICC